MKLNHPYENIAGGQWLRGNLHTHTTQSDGSRSQQEVIDDYARRGYDFLALSDHDVFTSNEDYAQLDSRGMVMIPGNEITRGGSHLLHVDGECWIEPSEDRQQVIDEAARQGGFIVVNHPNWQRGFDHCSIEKMRTWQGYVGVEIYNSVISRLDGDAYAVLKWETMLSEGRRVWAFAHDDSHTPGDVGNAWLMVHSADRSRQGIVAALRAGRFYPSTGVTISHIQVKGRRIRIETKNASRIRCTSHWGQGLAFVDTGSLEVEVPDHLPYVRFTCWGEGERFAWTQPFWVGED